jgi:hypothetical protein
MNVALLLIDDGRSDFLIRAQASLRMMCPPFDHVIHIDDTRHELGFHGAIQAGWHRILDETDADWVFHAESDFSYNEPVPLERMIAALDSDPELAQIVLKRQPWNALEHAAGGIVEQHPDDYTERIMPTGDVITTHRRFFSTNPCVYRASLCQLGWPQEPQSEGVFTHRLLRDPYRHFAFWGRKFDPPLVHHVGEVRAGTGY